MSKKGRKILPTLVILVLIISIFTNIFVLSPIVMIGNAIDITDSTDSSTSLNLSVLQLEPRVNWYGLENSTGSSMLNTQLDINQQYTFKVNISSDQGWPDIEYINITAWADLGNDSAYNYNNTLGGNINLFLQYENLTGNANYTMIWPHTEVAKGSMTDTVVTDPEGSAGNTECHNLSFSFTPSYQWRYAPGDGGWDDTPGYNDTWSWNFNITCDDSSGYHSYHNNLTGETIDEFGVYSYTEIISVDWPTISGGPGANVSVTDAGGSNNITIETRSNGNFSLSANITNLTHTVNSNYIIQNTSIWTRGGTNDESDFFTGTDPVYYYGGASTYNSSESDGTSKNTADIEWGVDIPSVQQAGDYEATIFYHLTTET